MDTISCRESSPKFHKIYRTYFSNIQINQLTDTVSLQQERTPPYVDDFLYICDGAYDRKELLAMEIKILKAIGFDLGVPLSYRFLRRYARVSLGGRSSCLLFPLVNATPSRLVKVSSLGDCTTTLFFIFILFVVDFVFFVFYLTALVSLMRLDSLPFRDQMERTVPPLPVIYIKDTKLLE